MFDVVTSLFSVLIFSPLILIVLAALFVEHIFRGYPFAPIFYKETRISQGNPFVFYKFNIFNQGVIEKLRRENNFIHTKELEHNGGLIFVGRLLKQVYMDELPQLYNVIRGDMSLIGPRPLNLEVYDSVVRNAVSPVPQTLLKAGITGNFQSYKGKERVTAKEMDEIYLDFYLKASPLNIIWYDLKIMFRTAKVILRARGI